MAEASKQVSNDIWNCLRALRDGMLDTVTLKRQQADEILQTNELLQKMVCDCTNKLMSEAADALAEQAETIQRLRGTLQGIDDYIGVGATGYFVEIQSICREALRERSRLPRVPLATEGKVRC